MAQYKGIFEPGEFVIVQDVFKRLTQDECFDGDHHRRDWLGRFVINAFQGGITDNDRLYEHCLAASSSMSEAVTDLRLL